ncbi:FAD-dependent oxidoreductase [Maritimibacter sp. UBA3975]|uniref:FAD-dependent oxidoreductase n=1 Tax=Maritimibacter sp. UBA3975 TaxID=1946833 RepID=UPI000C08E2FB|nr:FAD-dependent oxidoreductase [Maritimibacter sp. UBA3975]MAM63178.1 oxidoreductase [Maritimibacter sp.]|tara:strand:+ start:25969 stop:27204 length:1236 start_codon:yes stop_codon:yes gene_type:complete
MSGKIAIVGAGPSGCYLAQSLLKAAPDLEVDLIDALPVPYGLVRYGVAADHQGTKAVTRQFARVFERQGARFFGCLRLGDDVALEDLRAAYDAVVLATGMPVDRPLGIPGDDLAGVFGAGRLTRALYDHPDAETLPELGAHPLIVGNGNVAIDLLRLLAKDPDELAGSDLGAGPTDWLAGAGIESLTITGRSPAAAAKFDPVMIKELAKLGGVSIDVVGTGASDEPDAVKTLDALASIAGHGSGARNVTFRFGLTPAEVIGSQGQVRAVRFTSDAGDETIPCTSVLTAIGFDADPDLPRDALLESATDAGAGALAPGLYATGWFRRGPRGTIPENRADAQALATHILDDLTADPAKPGRAIFEGRTGLVDYDGWCRIDAAETEALPEGRCRAKITTREEMTRLASKGVTTG